MLDCPLERAGTTKHSAAGRATTLAGTYRACGDTD